MMPSCNIFGTYKRAVFAFNKHEVRERCPAAKWEKRGVRVKLYIKQKVFSWPDRFTVKDGDGRDRYSVEGELFSWGKKLHVYDRSGKEAAFIQQKTFRFMPTYSVYVNGLQAAEIVKEFSFLSSRYSIEGPGWDVRGSIMGHEYEITQADRTIVTIHKEWMTWGDCYELDVAAPQDELIALAVVLAIDCVIAASNNS